MDGDQSVEPGDGRIVGVRNARVRFVKIVGWDARFTHLLAGGLFYGFLVCRIAVLSGSAVVPVLVLYGPEKYITAIVSAVVFLAEVTIRVTRPGDHAISQSVKADALRLEHRRYITCVSPYDDPATSFERFAETVAEIRRINQRTELKTLQRTFETKVQRRRETSRDPEATGPPSGGL